MNGLQYGKGVGVQEPETKPLHVGSVAGGVVVVVHMCTT